MKELLLERGIDLSLSCEDDELKMPLVLVLLDEKGERSFKLYLADTVFENMAVDPRHCLKKWSFPFQFGADGL